MTTHIAPVPNEDSALRAWRKSKGLTLVQAGEMADTSHSVWLRWERRERVPRGSSLTRLARVTGLTTDKILGLTPHGIEPIRAGNQTPDGAALTEEDAARASSVPSAGD